MNCQELGAYQTSIVSELLTKLYGVDAKQAGVADEDMLRSIKDATSVAFLGVSCIHELHNIFDTNNKSTRWFGYSNTDLPFSTLRFEIKTISSIKPLALSMVSKDNRAGSDR